MKSFASFIMSVIILGNINPIFAQCYQNNLSAGKKEYNAGNYSKALEYFNNSCKCSDAGSGSDSKEWMQKCYDKLNYIETVNGVQIEMIFVKGGTFTMGCKSDNDEECGCDATPAHLVSLSDYYIGKFEVTQSQWKAVMGNNPSTFSGCNNCPVENVSWDDIQSFIKKLNELTKKNYRLPTEAEWEFSSRGGNKSKGYKYSGSNDINRVAWYEENSENKTHIVGQKQPNELGIYDMTGNVWEYCSDWWYGVYNDKNQINPKGPETGRDHLFRGGNYDSNNCLCGVLIRIRKNWQLDYGLTGFRLVLTHN